VSHYPSIFIVLIIMLDNPNRFHRRSIRFNGFDYSSPGAYFVTIVTWHRVNLFGKVVDGVIRVNQYGHIVATAWEWLQKQYPYVNLDPYIVMPNHFHGIIHIVEIDDRGRGGSRPAPTENNKIKPLGELIGAFKTTSAKQINLLRSTPGMFIWQRNYYEHIIRDQSELEDCVKYIYSNPENWVGDLENIQ
jgi:putative transposase